MRTIPKPDKSEYPEYAEMYIKLVPEDGCVLKHLKNNFQAVKNLFTLYRKKNCSTNILKTNGRLKKFSSILLMTNASTLIGRFVLREMKSNLCRVSIRIAIQDIRAPTSEIWIIFSPNTKPCGGRRFHFSTVCRKIPYCEKASAAQRITARQCELWRITSPVTNSGISILSKKNICNSLFGN